MIKTILAFLVAINFFYMPVSAQVFELSSAKKTHTIQNLKAEIYKPSKLIIGSKNNFIIKAEPNTYISILFSKEDEGLEPFMGQNLNLGEVVDRVDGYVGEKGILKLTLELPDKQELVGNAMYFETLIWTKEDFGDITKAKIIAPNGLETYNNALTVSAKPNSYSMPTFAPAIQGIGDMSDITESMDTIKSKEKQQRDFDYTDEIYIKNEPLILRNLRTQEEQNESTADE